MKVFLPYLNVKNFSQPELKNGEKTLAKDFKNTQFAALVACAEEALKAFKSPKELEDIEIAHFDNGIYRKIAAKIPEKKEFTPLKEFFTSIEDQGSTKSLNHFKWTILNKKAFDEFKK